MKRLGKDMPVHFHNARTHAYDAPHQDRREQRPANPASLDAQEAEGTGRLRRGKGMGSDHPQHTEQSPGGSNRQNRKR